MRWTWLEACLSLWRHNVRGASAPLHYLGSAARLARNSGTGERALSWVVPTLVLAQPRPGCVPSEVTPGVHKHFWCPSSGPYVRHVSQPSSSHRRWRYCYPLWQRSKQAGRVDDSPGWLHLDSKNPESMFLDSPLQLGQVASTGWASSVRWGCEMISKVPCSLMSYEFLPWTPTKYKPLAVPKSAFQREETRHDRHTKIIFRN